MPPAKGRPRVVRAELMKPRYRLAVVEDPGGRIVLRLPFIPEGVVSFVADQLAKAIPTLVQAAQYRDLASRLGDFLNGEHQRARRGGKG